MKIYLLDTNIIFEPTRQNASAANIYSDLYERLKNAGAKTQIL